MPPLLAPWLSIYPRPNRFASAELRFGAGAQDAIAELEGSTEPGADGEDGGEVVAVSSLPRSPPKCPP